MNSPLDGARRHRGLPGDPSMATLNRPPREGTVLVALVSVLALSLTLNVWLGWKVSRGGAPAASGGLAQGTELRSLGVLAADAKEETRLRLDDGIPTVLYVLSPSCHWCARNEANIRAL